jgi:hypothetical protein
MCYDIHTKLHKDWFRHSKVDKGDTQTHRQQGDIINLKLNSAALVRKRTIPTERPPHVDEVSANFCG